MEILKETKYLQFIVKEQKPKTKVVAVVNKTHQEEIGIISWFSRWRQYCFFPYRDTVWNTGCLNDINEMIAELTPVKQKPRQKTVGVIAFSIDDFIEWRIQNKHKPTKGKVDTTRKYEYRNTMYVCLSSPLHFCGYAFDKIVETQRAHFNKKFNEIYENARYGLIKEKH